MKGFLLKKYLFVGALIVSIIVSTSARADMFGGDVVVLLKILAEDFRRFEQLRMMLQQSKDANDYMREINRGLDNSIRLLEAMPIKDDKILGDLKAFQRALEEVQKVYGAIPKSPEESYQKLNDQAVAESLKMVTNANEYSEKQETNAAMIEARSWDMSPKGAMRMQAQVSSQILHTLNQILKMNSQLLKMQSAQMAGHMREEKQDVLRFQQFSKEVASTSKSFSGNLDLPRF